MKPAEGFMRRGGNFLESEVTDVVEQAIIDRFAQIAELATAGKPPVMALFPDLAGEIIEGAYWRLADRAIGRALQPRFEQTGRVAVPINGLPRAAVYKMIEPS